VDALPLPPVIQVFGIDGAQFLAGVDEMVASVDRLAEAVDQAMGAIAASVTEAAEAVERLGAAADGAMGAVGTSADEAASRSAGAADAIGEAMEGAAAKITGSADDIAGVMADLSMAVEDTAVKIAESGDQLAVSLDATVEASDRAAEMLDLAARSADAAGAAFDAAAASADALAASLDRAAAQADVEGASAKKAAGATAGMGTVMRAALLGVAIAAGFGVEQAAKFQSTMLTLSTQAGVSKSQLGYLSQGVLTLAGQVGDSPNSLAMALYHVESSFASVGITGPHALGLLQIAAEGAAVGHADLVDVTNALDATIVAGVPGITSYSQAMGVLNSIVGSGDMTMQDLANAMGSGVMAVAKSYGQTIYQVGAALAVLGDNNIRGAKAATDLRMAWQAIQAPLKTAAGDLAHLGLTSDTLANTMTHHGLSAAITQFIAHLKASKVPVDDWGQYVTQIFGKRAGVGIGILIDQLGRLDSKFPVLEKGASGFGDAWKATQQTLSQQWKNTMAAADALAISFGSVLLPAVTMILHALAQFGVFLEKNPAIAAFAGAILALAVGFKLAAEAEVLFDAVTDADPVMLILMAVVALAAGLYELYTHFQAVRAVVADVGHFLQEAWGEAVRAAGAVTRWFVAGPLAFIRGEIAAFRGWWAANAQEIHEVWTAVWSAISGVARAYWKDAQEVFKVGMAVLKAAWKTGWDYIRDDFETAWRIITDAIRFGLSDIGSVVSIFLDLLTGHWSKAWDSLKELPGKILHQIGKLVSDYIGGMGKTVTDLGSNLLSGISGVWDSIAGSASSGAASAGDAAAGAFATGWDAVYRDTVGEVVRAFEAVKGAITSGFDSWWATHGEAVEEVWHAVWTAVTFIFKSDWDAFMGIARPAFGILVGIAKAIWGAVTEYARIAWSTITSIVRLAVALITAVVKIAWDLISAIVKVGSALIVAVVKTAWDLIVALTKMAWAGITAVIKTAWDIIVGIFSIALDLVTGHWHQAWADLETMGKQVWNNIRQEFGADMSAIAGVAIQTWNNIKGFLSSTWGAIVGLAISGFNALKGFLVACWQSIYSSVMSAWNAVIAFFQGVPGKIIGALGNLSGLLFTAGEQIIQGLIGGIENMAGSALHAVESTVSSIYHGALSVLGIGSPSKVFIWIGEQITTGLANGITMTAAKAEAAARMLALKVTSAYGSGQITSVQENELLARITTALNARKLSSASTAATIEYDKIGADITARIGAGMMETLPQARAAARQVMQLIARELAAGKISAAQADELNLKISEALTARQERLVKTMTEIGLKMSAGLLSSLENATSASAAKTAVNKLITIVQEAWAAGDITTRRASSMTKWLEKDNTELQGLAAKRQAIAATIAAADKYAASVTSSTESWASLSNAETTAGGTSGADIGAGMQMQLNQIRKFSADIKKLASRGLSKALLDQIIQAGPVSGLAVAESLLDDTAAQIRSLNSTESQIQAVSTSLGKTAADTMYDTGKQAGKGFLSGLEAQESAITKEMEKIALAMVKALKKELKISSPSLVMRDAGHDTAAGVALGITDGTGLVTTSIHGLSKAITSGALGSPAVGVGVAGAYGAGGGGGVVFQPHITVNGFIGSEQQLAQQLFLLMQRAALQNNRRNPTNGLSLLISR
jgi:TP901 family phage tail tape measure protein